MNKLYFGDNLYILREHSPRRTAETTSHTGTERPRFPDPFDKLRASLTLGRSTFKRAAVEDMGAEQGKLL